MRPLSGPRGRSATRSRSSAATRRISAATMKSIFSMRRARSSTASSTATTRSVARARTAPARGSRRTGLGANNPLDWTLSTVGDAEQSRTSSGGDIGSPGASTRASVLFTACPGDDRRHAHHRIHVLRRERRVHRVHECRRRADRSHGVELRRRQRNAGDVDLSAFGTVAAGESVILTETEPAIPHAVALRCGQGHRQQHDWNLGRDDEINLYDNTATLVDRLTYGDDTYSRVRSAPAAPAAFRNRPPRSAPTTSRNGSSPSSATAKVHTSRRTTTSAVPAKARSWCTPTIHA